MTSDHHSVPTGYSEYRRASLAIGGRVLTVVSKQGMLSHGRTDPAARLLAEQMTHVRSDDVVVDMGCGNGMTGAVAASFGARRVLLTDRSIVNADAARRTLADNLAPNAEVWLGQGAHPLPANVPASIVTIRIPQERLALLQLIADAFRMLPVGGTCYVAGATNEGIKSAATTLASIFGSERTLARDAGHRLLVATKRAATPRIVTALDSPYLDPEAFHEYGTELGNHTLRVFSRPGVFSWDHLDEATAILGQQLRVQAGESVLDIGCGAGTLGTLAGMCSNDARVLMLDADIEAVRSAVRTASVAGLTRAEVRPSDVGAAVGDERFDVVVTNPPFHIGKATELRVPAQFIADAHTALRTGGRMYLVANRTLPYERVVAERFGAVTTLHDGPRFKVLMATRSA